MKIAITILDACGNIKATQQGQEARLIYVDGYDDGDKIKITVDTTNVFYKIKIDETIEAATVLLTQKEWYYTIDFSKRNKSLHQNAFDQSTHYLYIKSVSIPKGNIANNPLDQKENYGMYPHASANVETNGQPAFACTNVIDGLAANTHHGKWPFTSWGIGGRADACLAIDFHREVEITKIIIYLRAQFPHDSWWTKGTLSFSNQQKQVIEFIKTEEKQGFDINAVSSKVILQDLQKANDESLYPSLSLIEVYGNYK